MLEEEALDLAEGSFKKLVIEWNGPDIVYTTVKDWILSDQSGKPTVGNFFQYCFSFSENIEEDYEPLDAQPGRGGELDGYR